ncbi:hypothetical protein EZV62_015247 [Acer yangbiense]|uniref:Uncharacterized protein n=1 Tax=Acer yangbiense TaxID=1000413 RepID=A0A5C7HV60_9ROSI|nr:hypothetical protein EZV62_015247 [Acer yangbiense]
MDFDYVDYMLTDGGRKGKKNQVEVCSLWREAYRKRLAEALNMTCFRILAFKNKPTIVVDPFPKDFFSSFVHQPRPAKPRRYIPQLLLVARCISMIVLTSLSHLTWNSSLSTMKKALFELIVVDSFLNVCVFVILSTKNIEMRSHITNRWTGLEQKCPQLASVGDGNLVFIWDRSMASNSATQWLYRLEDHTATVKALAWRLFQDNLLASGESGAEKCIRL